MERSFHFYPGVSLVGRNGVYNMGWRRSGLVAYTALHRHWHLSCLLPRALYTSFWVAFQKRGWGWRANLASRSRAFLSGRGSCSESIWRGLVYCNFTRDTRKSPRGMEIHDWPVSWVFGCYFMCRRSIYGCEFEVDGCTCGIGSEMAGLMSPVWMLWQGCRALDPPTYTKRVSARVVCSPPQHIKPGTCNATLHRLPRSPIFSTYSEAVLRACS
ncbi:hypothetical protein VTI74DRAFT_4951 [Chaetomium olivicolor]